MTNVGHSTRTGCGAFWSRETEAKVVVPGAQAGTEKTRLKGPAALRAVRAVLSTTSWPGWSVVASSTCGAALPLANRTAVVGQAGAEMHSVKFPPAKEVAFTDW